VHGEESGEVGGLEGRRAGSGPAGVVHRHTGTLMSTGGPFWLLPVVFFLLPVLTIAKQGLDPKLTGLYAILCGLGVASLAWVAWARSQVVELHEGHLVHRRWGSSRVVPYNQVVRAFSELKSASRSQHASLVPRQGMTLWPTPRTLHVELASGDELTLVEMSEHALLERRLNDRAGGSISQKAS
jgi:hypothetical protein